MRGYGEDGTSMDKMKEQKDTETRKTESNETLRQNLRGSSMLMTMKRDKRSSRKMDR